ncbi:MAG TPA: FAD-dependent oxidoreductase [Polyangiaceae bacterium]|jgi:2-polyprenyl-6-methoxyphenol hydroxylase-like FAD-dependent oxidoreductase
MTLQESADVTKVKCCIVGGGPAGMMAGALLARAGVGVLVLEKHGDFLRDFRGDTVHPSTMDVLAELGWLEDFLQKPHQELRRIRAHIEGTEITLADFSRVPTRRKFVAFMPQWDFLNLIAEKARAFPGFELRMNAEATALVEDGGRIIGVRGEREGKPFTVEADLVLITDGRHSALREQADLHARRIAAPIDVLWFRVSRRPDDPPQSLGWLAHHRFLVLLDRGDYWQIASVIPKGAFGKTRQEGLPAFREKVAATAPFLGDRVGEISSFDDVKLLSVEVDRLDRWWRPGLLCIGDAAHAMSPIGGVGINLAVQDAVAAANLLAKPLLAGIPTRTDLARVQARREFPTRATQAVQVAVQERVIRRVIEGKRPVRVSPILRVIDRIPFLQRLPARLVGVGVRPEHVATG